MVENIERAAWFSRTTKPYLVVDADLRIRAVNRRYEEVTGHPRSLLRGQALFTVFPDNPDDPHADGVANLSASIERVFSSGERHWMGVQRYDVRDLSAPQRFVHKVWAPVNAPIQRDGRTVAVLHHAEDVTAAAFFSADALSLTRLDLAEHARILRREFPALGFPAVIGAVSHSHQMVLQALGNPHPGYAEMLARSKLEQLEGRPPGAAPADRVGGDDGQGVPGVGEGVLEQLGEDVCLRLLASQDVGRVAVSMGALPAIFPVNYRLSGNYVYFRTGEGTKLAAALANSVVAFEVDFIDPVNRSGWSVQVVGHARPSVDPRMYELIQPWAAGPRQVLVEVDIAMISGRRIQRGVPEA